MTKPFDTRHEVAKRWTETEEVPGRRPKIHHYELLGCGHKLDATRLQRNQEIRWCKECRDSFIKAKRLY